MSFPFYLVVTVTYPKYPWGKKKKGATLFRAHSKHVLTIFIIIVYFIT